MSQLTFIDIFDQIKQEAQSIKDVKRASTEMLIPARPSASAAELRKQFVTVFNNTGVHLRRIDVYRDFISLAARELDLTRIHTQENLDSCRAICARYSEEDHERFKELFLLMVLSLDAEYHDFLGAVYMDLELGNKRAAQYFTPMSLQKLMARLQLPETIKMIEKEGFVKISDPASGSAGLVIAYAQCLRENGLNPSTAIFAQCIDIDPVAADMTFIQLSLCGIAAEVITGDTLRMEFNQSRHTFVYYANDFESKLKFKERVERMRKVIQLMQNKH